MICDQCSSTLTGLFLCLKALVICSWLYPQIHVPCTHSLLSRPSVFLFLERARDGMVSLMRREWPLLTPDHLLKAIVSTICSKQEEKCFLCHGFQLSAKHAAFLDPEQTFSLIVCILWHFLRVAGLVLESQLC